MHIPVIPSIIRQLLPKSLIWNIKSQRKLYLTFDDGPVKEVTPVVLRILKEYNAKATFFCVGDNVRKNPEIFKQIIEEGHSVGNHTFSHLNGFKVPAEVYYQDTVRCSEYVLSNLFRPPHGRMSWSQYKMVNKAYRIVLWSVLTGDYNIKLSKEKVAGNAIRHSRDGSIIVFHDSIKASERMLYALPLVLEHFTGLGYSFEKIT
jgi:peptidoglycan/xylan/chitin deacetylase (PgdA/CDA1 family)